ncbi:MAG: UDP-N-acetylmuramate dehydrogenase [Pseudomonadota bacterium]
MDMAELEFLTQTGLRGELRPGEPMRRHVSWKAGGPAERAYVPADLADLQALLRALPADEPVLMVGLGSNLLVRDGGVRGTVILMHRVLNDLRLEARDANHGTVYAEAGVASPKVARFAAMHDLLGAEFLAGVPGTVGGALAMNAGCYGSETWDVVEAVNCVTRAGEVVRRLPSEFEVGYRHVRLRAVADEWFVGGWFRFRTGDGEQARRTIKRLLSRRISTQPLNQPNAGSVFRNPPGDHAARLIESCGLKGYRVGGAMVSPKHANFIVNAGGASAADIEAVIDHVEQAVERETGVRLQREVLVVGEKAS